VAGPTVQLATEQLPDVEDAIKKAAVKLSEQLGWERRREMSAVTA